MTVAQPVTAKHTDGAAKTWRALVLHPLLKSVSGDGRAPENRLEEAVGLALAIGLTVVHAEIVRLAQFRPATLIGSGMVETFAALIKAEEIEIVIVDRTLSPVQQRNLERAWSCKVIDRTGLILEIFGERARTAEGQLQVELAALSYQRSRLVRSWTHLERQRGGFGFLGGPGESQLEIDRRLIGDRIAKLRRELDAVARTRTLHRQGRRREGLPSIALVGYTNAGKSTLFNALTKSDVMAEDILFATLDPTIRALDLAPGQRVVLSDTVGFISDLPTDLVAAFRATLEEVGEADLILHVRDIAHPDSQAQRADVNRVLEDLGLGARLESGAIVEIWNKIDLLETEHRRALLAQAERSPEVVAVSARSGEGLAHLKETIAARLAQQSEVVEIAVPHDRGAAIAWLYDHGKVLERREGETATLLKVRLDRAAQARFHRLHGLDDASSGPSA